jgi:hypothetical protein
LKLYQDKELELFASKTEQQIDQLETMINKSAKAEMEAARILAQSAV